MTATVPVSMPAQLSPDRSKPLSAFSVVAFVAASFLGAFLVFEVQPIISKCVLPWYGGTPAVWTTCMLFFQVLLFGGYLYAHLLSRFPISLQAFIHTLLLLAATAVLPIKPADDWKPTGDTDPTWHLLSLLIYHVGLPYFVLSSTGPLMQAWLSRFLVDQRVYRLYAISNCGSLLALVSYPFVVEPLMSVSWQSTIWCWLFGAFVLLQTLLALKMIVRRPRTSPHSVQNGNSPAEPVTNRRRFGWIALSATASVLLLTTTTHVCQDIAVVPFFWVLPLSLYLISFIISFDSNRIYYPKVFATLALISLVLIQLSTKMPANPQLVVDASASVLFMFFTCVLCHGEVARLKPSVNHLTQYYLMISAGGAIGGLFVAMICPIVFDDYFERSIAMTAGGSIAFVLYFATRTWGSQFYDWRFAGGFRLIAGLLPVISIGAATQRTVPNTIECSRNFFGVLRIEGHPKETVMVHGQTIHGVQRSVPHQHAPTTYYGHQSGVGKVLDIQGEAGPIKVCGVGLGCGVLATYGRAHDRFDFIEINPEVIRLANKRFTFLNDSQASVRTILGDGRLVLERMDAPEYDVLILDAFSSDSIPTHLLTHEAMQLYCTKLSERGTIVFHISNKHLDLAPLVHKLADANHLTSRVLVSAGNEEDHTLPALWVVVAEPEHSLWTDWRLKYAANPRPEQVKQTLLWTDQRHDLMSVFRMN